MNYFNRKIKSFAAEGEATDQETILRLRQQIEGHLEDEMRGQGYVPSLDITPDLYWEYVPEKVIFKFAVIMYGSFVGKKKSKIILGLLGSHPIYKEPYSGENHWENIERESNTDS
jgi:hypothetical protein